MPTALAAAVFLAGAGTRADDAKSGPARLTRDLVGEWIHSHEEDVGGVRFYRPADHKLPPARGRDRFEIKKNGGFVARPIAPADGNEEFPGEWKLDGRKVVVTFKDPGRKPLVFEVVACDRTVLKVR